MQTQQMLGATQQSGLTPVEFIVYTNKLFGIYKNETLNGIQ